MKALGQGKTSFPMTMMKIAALISMYQKGAASNVLKWNSICPLLMLITGGVSLTHCLFRVYILWLQDLSSV